MDINVPADQIGRYAIDSLKGDVFKAALDFGTTDSTQPGVETSQLRFRRDVDGAVERSTHHRA